MESWLTSSVLSFWTLSVLTLLAIAITANAGLVQTAKDGKSIFCYFASWSHGRKTSTFDIEDIDPYLCTHLTYAFAKLDKKTFLITPQNPEYDLDHGGVVGAYRRFTNLKLTNPSLKTILSLGGWGDGKLFLSLLVGQY